MMCSLLQPASAMSYDVLIVAAAHPRESVALRAPGAGGDGTNALFLAMNARKVVVRCIDHPGHQPVGVRPKRTFFCPERGIGREAQIGIAGDEQLGFASRTISETFQDIDNSADFALPTPLAESAGGAGAQP